MVWSKQHYLGEIINCYHHYYIKFNCVCSNQRSTFQNFIDVILNWNSDLDLDTGTTEEKSTSFAILQAEAGEETKTSAHFMTRSIGIRKRTTCYPHIV